MRVENLELFTVQITLGVLYPRVRLLLRIDHQREASTLRNEDSVFFGELIIRESFEVPVEEGDWFDEEVREIVVLGMGDLEVPHLPEECVFDENSTVFRREGTCVGHERSGHERVTDEELKLLLEGDLPVLPALTCAFKTGDKFLRAFLLVLEDFVLIFEILFVRFRLLELTLENVDFILQFLQVVLEVLKFLLGFSQTLLQLICFETLRFDVFEGFSVHFHCENPTPHRCTGVGNLLDFLNTHLRVVGKLLDTKEGFLCDLVFLDVLEFAQEVRSS